MATKIRGITIELGADTTKLTDAFKAVNKDLSATQKSLNDVNKALKLNPDSLELLGQKSKYLTQAIDLSNDKVEELRKILSNLEQEDGGTGKLAEQMEAVKREIEATKGKAEQYEKQLAETAKQTEQASQETEDFGDELNDTGKEAQSLGDILKNNLSLTDLINVGKVAIDTVVKIGKAMVDTVKESASFADEMLTLSSTSGLSTDALQEYSYMAELVDTDLATITDNLKKLIPKMNEAQSGTGNAAEAFKKLGVQTTDSNGNLRDSNVVFDEVIAALGNMTNETERDALAMQLFGETANKLNPLIEAGSENLEAFKQEAHDTGYVLDEDMLNSLGNVDDAFVRLGNVWTSAKNQLASVLAPVVSDLTEKFVAWATSVDWKAIGSVISTVVSGIAAALKVLINIIGKVMDAVKPVVNAIANMFKGMKFEWPKIKLPHFGITPKGWKLTDLLKGTMPKLGIEWYGKGMEGLIMNQPTIFGMNSNGQLMGGGERGSETIVGTNRLMAMIQQATNKASGNGLVINIDNFNNNREQDIQSLATELEFYRKNASMAYGGR